MCLAVPGKIISVEGNDSLTRTGKVSFSGIVKEVNLAVVSDAEVGDYVLVHAGFAISVIEESEANRTFEYLREIEQIGRTDDEGQ